MSNYFTTVRMFQEPMIRASAYINNAPSYWFKGVLGLFLTLFLFLDLAMVFETSSFHYRDARGELTGYYFAFCLLISLITVLAPTWAIHMALGVLPRRVWDSVWVALACLAVMVILAQPAILALQESMAGAASLDLAAEAGSGSLLFSILQLVRMPIFVMAMLAAAIGAHFLGHALSQLRFINRLKEMVRMTSEAIERLTDGISQAGSLRPRLDDRRRETNVLVATVFDRSATLEASRIESYVNGEVLLTDPEGWIVDLEDMLQREEIQLSDKLTRCVMQQCPKPINFELLPDDSSTLPVATREKLLNYAAWLRRTHGFNTIYSELQK